MGRALRLVAQALVGVVALEVTLRAILLVPSIRAGVTRETAYDGPARMAWADARLLDALTGDPPIPWTDAGRGMPWDPVLGWTSRPGDAETDAHGCRDAGVPRAPDAVPIVLVGDSFSFGSDVPVGDSYGGRLEARRPDVDVHNLAMPGYDHLQAALRWEEQGRALAPRAVVLLGVGADTIRASFWFFGYHKPWGELDAGGGLVVRGQPVPSPAEALLRGQLRPRVLDLVDVVRERRDAAVDTPWRWPAGDRLAAAALDRWAASAKAAGVVPVMVAIPSPHEIVIWDGDQGDVRIDRWRGFYARWCQGRDFPCVDAWDEVRARVQVQPTSTAAHWDRAGNAVIAEVVERTLVEAGLIPDAGQSSAPASTGPPPSR